jgi:hypothetical protein
MLPVSGSTHLLPVVELMMTRSSKNFVGSLPLSGDEIGTIRAFSNSLPVDVKTEFDDLSNLLPADKDENGALHHLSIHLPVVELTTRR